MNFFIQLKIDISIDILNYMRIILYITEYAYIYRSYKSMNNFNYCYLNRKKFSTNKLIKSHIKLINTNLQ